MSDKSSPIVSLQNCPSYGEEYLRESLAALLSPWDGLAAFVKPGQRVLLKPNFILPREPEAAVTTHPSLILELARQIKALGAISVIGDSPAFSSSLAVAKRIGLFDRAQELGVEVVDLGRRTRVVQLDPASPWKRLAISREALDADLWINLPKVKAHCQMGLSLGIKNTFGLVGGKRKALLHFLNGKDPLRFARGLVALNQAVPPALTIADGICLLEKNGPTSGDPKEAGLLAASTNLPALDETLTRLLKVDPATVYCLEAAREMGWGPAKMDEIQVTGESLERWKNLDFQPIAQMKPINFSLAQTIRSVFKQMVFLTKAKFNR